MLLAWFVMTRRAKSSWLLSSTKLKLANSIRAAYTTSICLILMHWCPWAGPLTYISPTLSVVSAINLSVGMWIKSFISVTQANVFSSLLGVAIGSTYEFPGILVSLMFLALTFVNRLGCWDQLAKVISSLGLVLGCLWPYISNEGSKVSSVLAVLISVILIPFAITGATLFFPVLKLALNDGQRKALVVTNKLRKAAHHILVGYSLVNKSDYFSGKVSHALDQAKVCLSEISILVTYSEYEIIIFPHLKPEHNALKCFLAESTACVFEIQGLLSMLKNIVHNRTQETFARQMHQSIEDLLIEIDNVFGLIYLRFDCDRSCGWFSETMQKLENFLRNTTSTRLNLPRHVKSFDIETTLVEEAGGLDSKIVYSEAMGDSEGKMNESYKQTKYSSDGDMKSSPQSSYSSCSERLLRRRDAVNSVYLETRKSFVWKQRRSETYPRDKSSDLQSTSGAESGLDQPERNLIEDSINAEIQRLSIRNLGPRGAFLHRLSVFVDLLSMRYDSIFAEHNSQKDAAKIQPWWNLDGRKLIKEYFTSFILQLSSKKQTEEEDSPRDRCVNVLKSFVQPCKIALAVCLTSLLVVVPWSAGTGTGTGTDQADANSSYQTGLWAVVVVALIRNDNTSSSFLIGTQRLEGTVIGALFSFFIFRVLGDSVEVTIPAIIIWLSICAFFRDGARHGYAAVVAGFTPMVLLLGQHAASLERAYDRIEKTFIGIFIYLIIDNLIMPVKVHDGIRANILSSIGFSREFALQAIRGINVILKDIERRRKLSGTAGDDSIATLNSLNSQTPIITDEEFLSSQSLINDAELSLKAFQSSVTTAEQLLRLAVHEPTLFSKPFPLTVYERLVKDLNSFGAKGDALLRAVGGFINAMSDIRTDTQMLLQYLETWSFMARQIVSMQTAIDKSLSRVLRALRLLYETGVTSLGFSDIMLLSQALEMLLQNADENFRVQYLAGTFSWEVMDVRVLLAWQNVFESTSDLCQGIAAFGEAIAVVRDAE